MARLLQSTHYEIEFVREIQSKKKTGGTNRWLLRALTFNMVLVLITISHFENGKGTLSTPSTYGILFAI